MRVISKDPEAVIPPIVESDFDRFLIASRHGSGGSFVNFVCRDEAGFHFQGDYTSTDNYDRQYPHRWSDSYNRGYKTIVALMIAQWHSYDDWKCEFFVIESLQELLQFLDENQVGGRLRQFVINKWNSLPGNQNPRLWTTG